MCLCRSMAWPATALAALLATMPVSRAGPLDNRTMGWRNDQFVIAQGQERFSVQDIKGQTGSEIPVRIMLPHNANIAKFFAIFRGVPDNFKLSSGIQIGRVWLVSRDDLSDLKLIPPENYSGRFAIVIELNRGKNVSKTLLNVNVDIQKNSSLDARVNQEKNKTTKNISKKLDVKKISEVKERRFLRMAEEMLAQKDLAAARMIYKRLMDEGSEAGTLALAKSYDPAYVDDYKDMTPQPDPEKAREYYAVAAKYGNALAMERLVSLNAIRSQ